MRRLAMLATLLTAVAAAVVLLVFAHPALEQPDAADDRVARPPQIDPDYSNTVIPVNIAPLNFAVKEPGSAYWVQVRGAGRADLQVGSRDGRIMFPMQPWRQMLSSVAARGGALSLEVCVKGPDGRWQRFAPISNTVGPPIDPYLAYRLIGPVHTYYRDIRVCQRDLMSFDERVILSSSRLAGGCLNCHTFCNNSAQRMTLGIRSEPYGNSALVSIGGRIAKMDATWGYNAWHPSGQAVAYSLNQVRQFFHDGGAEVRDVVDLDSDVVVYRADTEAVETDPAIADPARLETYPAWSPDGKALYFCSAPIRWPAGDSVPPPGYADIRCELRRVTYDFATHRFGRPEIILSPAQTGLSALLPRVSPDGRWLLFTLCPYGCFPIHQPGSDLYLMDLHTRTYRRLACNSDQAETWHSWSSNSRWIAFSSRRVDSVFTRTFLAHVDAQGRDYKPFILPQKNPAFDESLLKTYSVPELVKDAVPGSQRAWARAARSDRPVQVQLPEISMTRKATKAVPTEPWRPLGKP